MENESQAVANFISNIFKYNKEYSSLYGKGNSQNYLEKQNPIATLVSCSDSRVSSSSFTKTDINNIFVVRNIGNQLETSKGSVEFGVLQLHTKLLIFMGHTECGAVAASLGSKKGLSNALKSELAPLRTSSKYSLEKNIITNIDNQVTEACKKFKNLVSKGDLLIIGLLYDIHNYLGGGHHRIYLTNLNGTQDKELILSNIIIENITDISLLDRLKFADLSPNK